MKHQKWILILSLLLAKAESTEARVLSLIREPDFKLTRDFSWVLENLDDQRIYIEEVDESLLRPYIENYPICDSWIKISQNRYLTALGDITPTRDKDLFFEVKSESEVLDEIDQSYPGFRLLNIQNCWDVRNDGLHLKPEGEFDLDGIRYRFESLGSRLNVSKIAFDATASVTVYPSRVTEGTPQTFPIETTDAGYLTSSKLKASTYATSSSSTRLFNQNNIFNLSQNPFAAGYDETASFVHGMNHLKFLESKYQFSYYSQSPINLLVANTGSQDTNNASYVPSSDPNSAGQINIGKGDGIILKNLGKDEDVVSHELGHYLIFKWIYQPSSIDALSVHEGLSDFFVYDRTGNNCLGESICPTNRLCISTSCLRTGAVDFRYGDARWTAETSHHKRGQLLATFLWNVRSRTLQEGVAGVQGGVAGLLAYTALSKVTPNPTIEQYMNALIYADTELFQGKYNSILVSEMTALGLPFNGGGTSIPTSPAPSPSKSKKWWQFGCSTATNMPFREFNLLWLLLLSPPLMIVFCTRRKKINFF